jgi:uncharacterized UBP type Zn finger protein
LCYNPIVNSSTGSGGNNHAVDYYKETGYPLCVKLGTITQSEAGKFIELAMEVYITSYFNEE